MLIIPKLSNLYCVGAPLPGHCANSCEGLHLVEHARTSRFGAVLIRYLHQFNWLPLMWRSSSSAMSPSQMTVLMGISNGSIILAVLTSAARRKWRCKLCLGVGSASCAASCGGCCCTDDTSAWWSCWFNISPKAQVHIVQRAMVKRLSEEARCCRCMCDCFLSVTSLSLWPQVDWALLPSSPQQSGTASTANISLSPFPHSWTPPSNTQTRPWGTKLFLTQSTQLFSVFWNC